MTFPKMSNSSFNETYSEYSRQAHNGHNKMLFMPQEIHKELLMSHSVCGPNIYSQGYSVFLSEIYQLPQKSYNINTYTK